MNTLQKIYGCLLISSSIVLSSCRGGVNDIDGNQYKTLRIGSQIWMAENINVSRFRNGDSIPEVRSPEEWTKYGSEGKAACCIIQNDRGNAGKYGRLYNWYALADPRGFAPKGWHVPSDEEWTGLTNYLGNGVAAALKMRAPGSTDQGNESGQKGFCGLPGGARAVNGEFYGLTSYGYWWSSTETSPATALIRILSYVDCDIHFFDYSKSCGISVRCIRN